MRCKENQVCMIIRDELAAECNIGARVTVRKLDENDRGVPAWFFDSASRALKRYLGEGIFWIEDSQRICGTFTVYPDSWLMPLTPDDEVLGEVSDVIARIPHSEHA